MDQNSNIIPTSYFITLLHSSLTKLPRSYQRQFPHRHFYLCKSDTQLRCANSSVELRNKFNRSVHETRAHRSMIERPVGNGVGMAEAQFSADYNDLEEKAKTRYSEMLRKLGGMADTYLKWQSGFSIAWQLWPDVEYPDICNLTLPHRVSKCLHGRKLESVQKYRRIQLLRKWLG